MSQIGLPFDWQAQAQAGSFLLSDANELAARHIEGWRDWPVPISVLSGPPRSGKSTLGRHFSSLSDGVVIDDVEREDERHLFHQWNIARDGGRPLLLIARDAPLAWPVALPDLRSRLAAVPHVRINQPDDELVRRLIEIGLAKAGTAYSADTPEWLARRIERSYEAVSDLMVRLNSLSLAASRKVSVPLLREALQNGELSPIVRNPAVQNSIEQSSSGPMAGHPREEEC